MLEKVKKLLSVLPKEDLQLLVDDINAMSDDERSKNTTMLEYDFQTIAISALGEVYKCVLQKQLDQEVKITSDNKITSKIKVTNANIRPGVLEVYGSPTSVLVLYMEVKISYLVNGELVATTSILENFTMDQAYSLNSAVDTLVGKSERYLLSEDVLANVLIALDFDKNILEQLKLIHINAFQSIKHRSRYIMHRYLDVRKGITADQWKKCVEFFRSVYPLQFTIYEDTHNALFFYFPQEHVVASKRNGQYILASDDEAQAAINRMTVLNHVKPN